MNQFNANYPTQYMGSQIVPTSVSVSGSQGIYSSTLTITVPTFIMGFLETILQRSLFSRRSRRGFYDCPK